MSHGFELFFRSPELIKIFSMLVIKALQTDSDPDLHNTNLPNISELGHLYSPGILTDESTTLKM